MQSNIAFTRRPVAHCMDCLHGPVSVVELTLQENTLCICMVHLVPRLLWLRKLQCEHVLAVELPSPILSIQWLATTVSSSQNLEWEALTVLSTQLKSGIHGYLHAGSLAAGLQEGC